MVVAGAGLVFSPPAGPGVAELADSGARYTDTYDDDAWLKEQGININPYIPVVVQAWDDKVWNCV